MPRSCIGAAEFWRRQQLRRLGARLAQAKTLDRAEEIAAEIAAMVRDEAPAAEIEHRVAAALGHISIENQAERCANAQLGIERRPALQVGYEFLPPKPAAKPARPAATVPAQPTREQQIAAFLAARGATQCPPARLEATAPGTHLAPIADLVYDRTTKKYRREVA